MKNSRALMMLIIAMVAGLAAVVFASRWLMHTSSSSVTSVAVATTDLNLGEPLGPNQIHMVSWPSGSVPTGAFADTKELEGRVVRTSLARGEPVIESKLAPVGTKGGLSAVIADGSRAITVRVNDVVGVAGFALPGNYVDVMVNAQQDKDKAKGEQNSQISKTVLEKVLVLAVAQEANRDDTKPKVVSAVTLELSLEDSEKLDLARSVGTLSLVLRNQMDKTTVATGGITKGQLFGEKEILPIATTVAAAPPARPRVARTGPVTATASQCVEVIQNAARSLACF